MRTTTPKDAPNPTRTPTSGNVQHLYPRKWQKDPALGAQPGDMARCGWIKRAPHVGPRPEVPLCAVCADMSGRPW